MTTISSVSGSVSSIGIGSGLDVTSIISSLMGVEAEPLTLLQNSASAITTQISSVGQITSLTSALGEKAQALTSPTLWNQTTSASSDTSSVTASTSTGTAVAGDYQVSVSQLAQGQTVTAAALATADSTLSAGTLTIQLGTWAGSPPTSFTNQTGSNPVSINIPSTGTSLSSIRDTINAASAGVTASIITDASGSRLSLRSTATGAENGFQITATEDPDNPPADGTPGLSALSYDPSTTGSQMSLNQSSANALATVNGIPVESASNTLANISDGLSITLLKKTTSPIDVTVSADTASMQKAITDFVSAYTALNASIHTATKYDPGTTVAAGTSTVDGPLEGDPSIISLQNQMRGILNTPSTTSTMYSQLADIGITIQADGSLAADSTKLTAAMANPDQLKALFATQGTTPEDTGIAQRFSDLTDGVLGADGSLSTRATGLKSELTRNGANQTEMQSHLDATQARLTAQYQALDTTMASMSALSSYVSQQVALMEK